jgi:hypothetical protein
MLKGIEIDKSEFERELVRKHEHFTRVLGNNKNELKKDRNDYNDMKSR